MGGQLFVTFSELTTPSDYADLACVFFEDKAKGMSDQGEQDLAIDLVERKEPPWGPIYNLSAKELDVFQE